MAFAHCDSLFLFLAIETWRTRVALVSVKGTKCIEKKPTTDRMAQHAIAQQGMAQFEGMRKQTAVAPRISRAASMVRSLQAPHP